MQTVLLPDGNVLMPGGNDIINMFNSTEVFDPGLGNTTVDVPIITSLTPSSITVPASTTGFTSISITGTGFQDNNNRFGSEASNGVERNSATNYPIVQVSRIGGSRYDNDFTRYLPFDIALGNSWDSTSTIVQFPHGVPNQLPPGVYAVKVIANGIASQPAYLNVGVSCDVTADFSADTVCLGDSTSFTDLSSGTLATCWKWLFGDGDSALVQTPKHLYLTDGTFTVTLITHSEMGCVDSITKTVVVNPLPILLAVPTTDTICSGDTATLAISGAVTYVWAPGVTLTATSGTAVGAFPTANITYTVVGTDVNGCVDSVQVPVVVNPIPTVTTIPVSATICSGDTLPLVAGGAITYSWTPGTGLSSSPGN